MSGNSLVSSKAGGVGVFQCLAMVSLTAKSRCMVMCCVVCGRDFMPRFSSAKPRVMVIWV